MSSFYTTEAGRFTEPPAGPTHRPPVRGAAGRESTEKYLLRDLRVLCASVVITGDAYYRR
jgi:hypothetical protein